MMIGDLIAFALVTETVFQWPGMGQLFVQAVMFIDIPVMAAYLMIVSVIFVTINTHGRPDSTCGSIRDCGRASMARGYHAH